MAIVRETLSLFCRIGTAAVTVGGVVAEDSPGGDYATADAEDDDDHHHHHHGGGHSYEFADGDADDDDHES